MTAANEVTGTEYEVVRVKVCRGCEARYSTMASQYHKCPNGGGGFRTVKERRPREPMRIVYQPACGPRGRGGIVRLRVALLVVVSVVVLFAVRWGDPAAPGRPTHYQGVRCTEDMACWDCETMGNHICGRP